ncbi:aminotransferase class IV [Lutibacter sp. B2]|nr:aminotransferase class IV [Lutibacter sp. B2]
MKKEAVLNYYIFNGKIYSTSDMTCFDHIIDPMIYEVIRIIDGKALFLEEHLERMRKSTRLLGCELHKSEKEIADEIYKLIEKNECKNMNVKLICSNLKNKEQDFLCYLIKSHYPEESLYERGIHTILYYSERENPNAKVINTTLRESVNNTLKEENAFEALLVNKEDFITEGSRSNMFFLKGNTLYTAPAGDVLLGVTRDRIMKVCKNLNVIVIEECIDKKEIVNLDGAFMTGTSVNVLPIRTIGEVLIDSVNNFWIQEIANGYKKEVQEYLKKAR